MVGGSAGKIMSCGKQAALQKLLVCRFLPSVAVKCCCLTYQGYLSIHLEQPDSVLYGYKGQLDRFMKEKLIEGD